MKRYIKSDDSLKPHKYCRYVVKVTPFKDKWKITVIDNYFDKHDVAFYNPESDGFDSYSDVATQFVMRAVNAIELAGKSFPFAQQGNWGVYTEGPHGDVVSVEPYRYRVAL